MVLGGAGDGIGVVWGWCRGGGGWSRGWYRGGVEGGVGARGSMSGGI